MNRVKAHFDAVAPTYHRASECGLWKWLRQRELSVVAGLLGTKPTGDVLDLGSGSGYYGRHLFSGCRSLVCVDFSAEMLRRCDILGSSTILADVQEFLSERQFDVILCAGALEFLERPQAVFANAAKMLKPSGVFVALLPEARVLGKVYQWFHLSHGMRIRLFRLLEIQRWAQAERLQIARHQRIFPFSLAAKLVKADSACNSDSSL